MKKYLKEIEVAGLVLVVIGIVLACMYNSIIGGGFCGIGLLLWIVTVLYKAFHWNDYARENKQNISIILLTIFLLLIQLLRRS